MSTMLGLESATVGLGDTVALWTSGTVGHVRDGQCVHAGATCDMPISGSITSLALAVYLRSTPFIIGILVAQDWYFYELCCHLLLSLDLLTITVPSNMCS